MRGTRVLERGSLVVKILATLLGQQFLYILREDLVADFYRSLALLELLARVIENMLEEGRQLNLAKKGLEDTS